MRIERDGCLVSAPLTHLNAALISQAAADWEVAARMISRTLHHRAVEVDPPSQGVSDIVLLGRIQTLGNLGDV